MKIVEPDYKEPKKAKKGFKYYKKTIWNQLKTSIQIFIGFSIFIIAKENMTSITMFLSKNKIEIIVCIFVIIVVLIYSFLKSR